MFRQDDILSLKSYNYIRKPPTVHKANSAAGGLAVREYINLRPAVEVEAGAGRQEVETAARKISPSLARQHRIELPLEPVQLEHVGGGIFLLRVREFCGAPVRWLLLLGDIAAEKRL